MKSSTSLLIVSLSWAWFSLQIPAVIPFVKKIFLSHFSDGLLAPFEIALYQFSYSLFHHQRALGAIESAFCSTMFHHEFHLPSGTRNGTFWESPTLDGCEFKFGFPSARYQIEQPLRRRRCFLVRKKVPYKPTKCKSISSLPTYPG